MRKCSMLDENRCSIEEQTLRKAKTFVTSCHLIKMAVTFTGNSTASRTSLTPSQSSSQQCSTRWPSSTGTSVRLWKRQNLPKLRSTCLTWSGDSSTRILLQKKRWSKVESVIISGFSGPSAFLRSHFPSDSIFLLLLSCFFVSLFCLGKLTVTDKPKFLKLWVPSFYLLVASCQNIVLSIFLQNILQKPGSAPGPT